MPNTDSSPPKLVFIIMIIIDSLSCRSIPVWLWQFSQWYHRRIIFGYPRNLFVKGFIFFLLCSSVKNILRIWKTLFHPLFKVQWMLNVLQGNIDANGFYNTVLLLTHTTNFLFYLYTQYNEIQWGQVLFWTQLTLILCAKTVL